MRDPYSFEAATQRQRRDVAPGVSPDVYTSALIVDGRFDAVSSNSRSVDHMLREAVPSEKSAAPVDVEQGPAGLNITVGVRTGNGILLLVGHDRLHQTPNSCGENSGRILEEANIVHSMPIVATSSGKPVCLQVPNPTGQDVVVLLQRDDGRIVGAGSACADSRAS